MTAKLVFLLLAAVIIAAQDAGTDPRLSDPAFIKVRDEALAAKTCADRTNPVGVKTPSAKYPDTLKGTHSAGWAIMEGVILTDGSVSFIRLMRSTEPEFGTAAVEAFSHYRYKAATCGGKPVPTIVTVTARFDVH